MPQEASRDTNMSLEDTLRFSAPSNSAALSLGRFDQQKFNRIAENIVEQTSTIRNHLQTLEKALRLIGTKDDSKSLRDELENVQKTASQSIKTTVEDLVLLKKMLKKRQEAGGKEKFQVERLSRDLKAFVKLHSDLQKQIVAKMRTNFVRQSCATQGLPRESVATIMQINVGGQAQIFEAQAQILEEEIEFETGLLLEREQRILELERNIIDVNEIMQCLATMMQDQGEVVDLIESNVEETLSDVEAATVELDKAETAQTKNRKCTFIMLAITAVVLIAIITILVVTLKG